MNFSGAIFDRKLFEGLLILSHSVLKDYYEQFFISAFSKDKIKVLVR